MNRFVVIIVGLSVVLSWAVIGLPVDSLAGSSTNLGGRQFNSPNLFDKVRGLQTDPSECQFDAPGLCDTTSRPATGPGDCPFNSSNLCDRIGNVTAFDGPFTFDRSRAGGPSCFPCFRPFH